jgi:hypothetical protein
MQLGGGSIDGGSGAMASSRIGDTENWSVLGHLLLATRLIEKEREVSCRHPPLFVAKRKA